MNFRIGSIDAGAVGYLVWQADKEILLIAKGIGRDVIVFWEVGNADNTHALTVKLHGGVNNPFACIVNGPGSIYSIGSTVNAQDHLVAITEG